MTATKVDTLRVPGAQLYFTVRGSGPLLLILQGGDGDAEGCNGLAAYLVAGYTVVTYDRRGLSRSPIDDPTASPCLETHSDDAHRLLAALTDEPAFVFGGSLGALLGLDLVACHPEQVRILVAHEPPVPELLPDAERALAVESQLEMEETYRREGAAAAIKKMASALLNFADREPDLELPRPNSQQTAQRAANMAFFLAHDAPSVRRYKLDLVALKRAGRRIVPAAGRTSRETWVHHCTAALADRLGTPLVEFPGGHNGYILHPRAFAARLREVLSGQ